MNKLFRSLFELFVAMILLTPLLAVVTIVIKVWWSMIITLWALW